MTTRRIIVYRPDQMAEHTEIQLPADPSRDVGSHQGASISVAAAAVETSACRRWVSTSLP
jgi:hypothetical protein